MVKATNCSASEAQLHGFTSQLYVTLDESLHLFEPQFFYKMKTKVQAGLTLHDSIIRV